MKILKKLVYGFIGIAIMSMVTNKAIPEKVELEGLSKQERLAISLIAKDENIRENAKKELIALGEKAIPVLEECLKSEDWYMRTQVVNVLKKIKGTESTNLLLKVALEDGVDEAGLCALIGLKDRKERINTIALYELLKKHKFCEPALDLVSKDTTNHRTANLLIEGMFNKDTTWQTKRDIARKLGELHKIDPKVRAKPLLEMIRRECETPTPIETGGDGGGPIDYSGLQEYYFYPLTMIGISAVPFLKEAFNKEKDNRVKEWIVIALGKLGDKSTILFLKKVFNKEKDNRVKEWIVIALGKLGDKEVFPKLLDMVINSKDAGIRANAVDCLKKFEDPRAIPVLKKALKDPFYKDTRGGCIVMPPGYEYMYRKYPVRQAAYFALLKLGVKVERKGTGPREYHEYKVIEK